MSDDISDVCDGETVEIFFNRYQDAQIFIPEKFAPHKEFLEYHNDVVFQNWK